MVPHGSSSGGSAFGTSSPTPKPTVGLPGNNGTSAFQMVQRRPGNEVHPSVQNRSSVVSPASAQRTTASTGSGESDPDSPPTTPLVKKRKKLKEED